MLMAKATYFSNKEHYFKVNLIILVTSNEGNFLGRCYAYGQ